MNDRTMQDQEVPGAPAPDGAAWPEAAAGSPRAPTLLAQTAKAALVVTVLSVAATQLMAHRTRPGAAPAGTVALRAADPEVTGSLGVRSDLRLDPCTAPAGR